MGACYYRYNRLKECIDIDDFLRTWKEYELDIFNMIVNSKVQILKNEVALLHHNITDTLIQINYNKIEIKYEDFSKLVIDYAEAVDKSNEEEIKYSFNEVKKLIMSEKFKNDKTEFKTPHHELVT